MNPTSSRANPTSRDANAASRRPAVAVGTRDCEAGFAGLGVDAREPGADAGEPGAEAAEPAAEGIRLGAAFRDRDPDLGVLDRGDAPSGADEPHRDAADGDAAVALAGAGGVVWTGKRDQAVATGILPIRACHSFGPVTWADVPPASTATVTGMSTTSNS